MNIKISHDVEDIIRQALAPYMTAYCRPYPANPTLPNVLITQTGGDDDHNDIDHLTVAIDARADLDEDAWRTLRYAIGALKAIAANQTTPLRCVEVVSSGSWDKDTLNQTVAMCSASLRVTLHKEHTTIDPIPEPNNP